MMRAVSDDPVPAASWWGVGAAATQCEGAAPRADWAGWEAEGWAPPSSDGNGFRTRYADDFAHWADHGLRHYRLTVEWARLEPFPGRWDAMEAAHLRSVLAAGVAAGVEVWACLLHGSAPGWFTDDQRGWRAGKEAVLAWARHVDRVAEALGDLVAGWVPIHEPDLLARLGYLDGTFPPGRQHEDDARTAAATLAAAEAEAARLLRSGGRPVAVTPRLAPGRRRDDDDLLVVAAPVAEVERELERVAGGAPDASLLVVLGDPSSGPESSDEDRARRLRTAVAAVAGSGARVHGGFVLPAVDGYEWHRGFEPRLGVFDRDRNPRQALAALGYARER
jgi:beta-glucosidase/6-phospho-beta-glucosidase/beta-galactosidase